MRTESFKKLFILLYFAISLKAYDIPYEVQPYEPTESEFPIRIYMSDLYNDLKSSNFDYLYSMFNLSKVDYITDNGKLKDIIMKYNPNPTYDNPEEVLEFLRTSASEDTREKKRMLAAEFINSALYRSPIVGTSPLELELKHSNVFGSTMLLWKRTDFDLATCFKLHLSGYYHYYETNPSEAYSYDAKLEVLLYKAQPDYRIYRVVNGQRTLIKSIRPQAIRYLGAGVDLDEFKFIYPKPKVNINLSEMYDFYFNFNGGNVMFIDHFSEYYVKKGDEVSYIIEAFTDYPSDCYGNDFHHSSEVYLDSNADGFVDFAPRKGYEWLVPVLSFLLN